MHTTFHDITALTTIAVHVYNQRLPTDCNEERRAPTYIHYYYYL